MVNAVDPLAYPVGLAAIIAACLVAALFPAQSMPRIDPIATLRAD